MTDSNDLLATLAQAERSAELTQARITRQGASDAIQASYHALFDAEEEDFPADERALLAQRISEWHGASALAAHYAARQQRRPATTPRLSAALDHAERLAFKPAEAAPEHLQALQQAGWSPAAIVTLSQLIAFVSFQSRLLYGYRLLAGDAPPAAEPVPAASWRRAPLTHGGRPAPPAFTRQELGWEPWIAAKPLAEFDAAGLALLARFGHTDSDYFRLLARNHPLLEQRTLADRATFYTSGGLARQDRELAATVASKVNGCIYCASVHARKAAQLSKREEEVQRLLDVAPGGVLSAGQQEAWRAQIEFAAALSATPPRADAEQLATLRRQGLSELALLDLVQSTAFFAWANRLMLTLGEPFEP